MRTPPWMEETCFSQVRLHCHIITPIQPHEAALLSMFGLKCEGSSFGPVTYLFPTQCICAGAGANQLTYSRARGWDTTCTGH